MQEYTFIVTHYEEDEEGNVELVGEETEKVTACSFEGAETMVAERAEIFQADCGSTFFNIS